MTSGSDRRGRLERSRLYLVTDAAMPLPAVRAALAGGVDMVQLRDRSLDDAEVLKAAAALRAACDEHDALLWINDRPDLALAAGADGVHVGQDDAPVAEVRRAVGPELLIGLSTHEPGQLEAGIASGADQLSVGPVWETPTKPGRPAAGLEYVRHAAARRPAVPWFAIGGIDAETLPAVREAGAERVVVVRAVRDASDPEAAARGLATALEESPLAQRDSRKRRKARQRATAEPRRPKETDADRMARGYARGRAKDEEARAALVPLAPGERPTAVTVAFGVAVIAFVANLVALALKLGQGNGDQTSYTLLGCILLAVMAWGMWHVRYWAVLGMQALLGISVLLAALALITAVNVTAAIFALVIVVGGGTLFWFLVKSMARIQMPRRPGA